MTSGRNGVRTITQFDTSDLPVTVAGEVPDFDATDFLDTKEARRTDRFSQYAIAVGARWPGPTPARPRSSPSAAA